MKSFQLKSLFILTVAAALMTASSCKSEARGWTTDLPQALEMAKADQRPVMVDFTGLSWCAPCIAMHKNVFTNPDFFKAVADKVILVEIDIPFDGGPEKAKGDVALGEKNKNLAAQYKVEMFPMIVLLDPTGKEFSRFFAADYPNVQSFVAKLNEELLRSKVK